MLTARESGTGIITKESWLTRCAGLYTDESPGLKVDPVVVMTLSVVFIFSVVALHGMHHYLHLD